MLALAREVTFDLPDFGRETKGAFLHKFLADYTQEEKLELGGAIALYMEKMRACFGAILAGENWVKEKVAKSIEYYVKRVELIQKMLDYRTALGDSQIRRTLQKDNFGILQDFSEFQHSGKIPIETY